MASNIYGTSTTAPTIYTNTSSTTNSWTEQGVGPVGNMEAVGMMLDAKEEEMITDNSFWNRLSAGVNKNRAPKWHYIPDFDKMEYREFAIPKKSGKLRKICAPNEHLLKFQQVSLQALYAYYNKAVKGKDIEDIAHGFLPAKNVISAATKHIGYKCTVMMDISNFFDSVSRDMIPEELRHDKFFHANGYCAQGFATSPMLANIAILETLKNINQRLKDRFGVWFMFTIYADDLQISLNNENKKENNVKDVVDIVREELKKSGFELNENKTRTKYAKYGWRRILGVNVGETEIRATRKTMRKLRAARHANNGPSIGGLVNWSRCHPPRPLKDESTGRTTKRPDRAQAPYISASRSELDQAYGRANRPNVSNSTDELIPDSDWNF